MTDAATRRRLAADRARRYRQRQRQGAGLRRVLVNIDLFAQADRLISAGRLSEAEALDDSRIVAEIEADLAAMLKIFRHA